MIRASSIITAFLSVLLVGCAGVQSRDEIRQLEQELSVSGFQVQRADTPAKLTQLENLPQHKILSQEKDGQPVDLYADAKDCKCLYVGTEADHNRFRALLAEQRREQEVEAAQRAIDAQWLDTEAFAEPVP